MTARLPGDPTKRQEKSWANRNGPVIVVKEADHPAPIKPFNRRKPTR